MVKYFLAGLAVVLGVGTFLSWLEKKRVYAEIWVDPASTAGADWSIQPQRQTSA